MNPKRKHSPFHFEIKALQTMFQKPLWKACGVWIIIEIAAAALLVAIVLWFDLF